MKQVLILGLGNVLWADEGYGVRAVEHFHQNYSVEDNVTVMDGGTQGLALYPYTMSASHILVFDAIDFRLEPGTVKVLRDQEVPVYCTTKISPHQTTFSEVLAHAELLRRVPEKITVIGVQPETLNDFGGGLTTKIRALIPGAVELAVEELKKWGVPVISRAADETAEALNAQALITPLYEGERPSEEEACRIGDQRFLSRS